MSGTKHAHAILEFFRTASWLTADRAHAWCRVLALMMAVITLAWIGLSHGGLDIGGKPLGTDFNCFWASSHLILTGHAADAYNPIVAAAEQRALFPAGRPAYTAFFYPPTFLLVCWPLALVPYLWSLALWLAAGLACVASLLRRVMPRTWSFLPILAFPGLLVNAGHGQNGFATATCFGLYCVLGDRRPFLAGMCLGPLICKPHLLIVSPVTLIAAGRWRALGGLTVSALALTGLSWLAFGTKTWLAFAGTARVARAALEQGALGFEKMQSLFAAVRLLHGGIGLGYILQGAIALAAVAVAARACKRRPGAPAEGALLICSTCLCTPYLFDYDLVMLAFPLAWVVGQAQATGWRGWEKVVLLLAYALPLLSRPASMDFGVPLAPEVLSALLLVVARRAMRGGQAVSGLGRRQGLLPQTQAERGRG